MKPLWRAHLHLAWARHGWVGALGLLLCLLAPAIWVWGADPERAAATALEHRLAQMRREAAAQAAAPQTTPPTITFEQGLPPPTEAVLTVKSLHALAVQHGLQTSSGDYKLTSDGSAPWQRYQIHLPVSGPYHQVKAWAAAALAAHPSLALDDWQMARDNVGQATVQARLRWTLYLGAQP